MKVDENAAVEVVNRLRRVQGQVAGIIRMIEEQRECADVLTQVAAASRALDRAGFKIVASGMRQCMAAEAEGRSDGLTQEQLEKYFLTLA